MEISSIGDQVKINLTNGWEKFAIGYQSLIISRIRMVFDAIVPTVGVPGAHVVLGGAAIGLWTLGRNIWKMPFKDPDGDSLVETSGPKSPFMQKVFRVTGVACMMIAAAVAGSLVAIGGGSVGLSFGVTSGITLVGLIL